MSDIQDLTEKILAFSRERDWLQFHNPKDLAESIIIEAAELLEHFQWKNGEEIAKHVHENKQDISEEIADVVIYTLELAHHLNIDLKQAIEQKIVKNGVKYPVEKAKGSAKKYTQLTE